MLRCLVSSLVLGAVFLPVIVRAGQPSQTRVVLMEKLDSIIIPRIDLTDAFVPDAIECLRNSAEQAAPPIKIKFEPAVRQWDPLDRSADAQRITLQVANIPLKDASQLIASLAGAEIRFDSGEVWIGDDDRYIEKRLLLPQAFVPNTEKNGWQIMAEQGYVLGEDDFEYLPETKEMIIRLPYESMEEIVELFQRSHPRSTEPFHTKLTQNARLQIELLGVDFPEGSTAVYDPGSRELQVRNTLRNQDQLTDALDAVFQKTVNETPAAPDRADPEQMVVRTFRIPEEEPAPLSFPPDPLTLPEYKLNTTRIPEISFENATIPQALEFFRAASVRFSHEPDEDRGLGIVYTPGPERRDKRVTFRVKNISLGAALSLFAQQAGLAYRFDPHAVYFAEPPAK